MPIVPTVSALGADFYGGAAGVALFLAQLHAFTDSPSLARTARGAVLQAIARSETLPERALASFYSGAVGIAYAAARVALLLGDAELLEAGLKLAHRAHRDSDGSQALDVVGGNAGSVAPLLWLAELPGGEGLDAFAMDLATGLAEKATKEGAFWSWETELASGNRIGDKPLCGYAHGASGMGLALIEMGARERRADWVAGGLAAFAYEDALFDVDQGNWPDLRSINVSGNSAGSGSITSSMIAWCHGAPGIGLARLRAYQLLPKHRADLLPGIHRAVATTASSLNTFPADADASPCHGRTGLAELMLFAADVLGEPSYRDDVVKMWTRVARRRPIEEWACGVASGRNNPSLMLGYSGVGYGLLRAANPQGVSSTLLVSSSETLLSQL